MASDAMAVGYVERVGLVIHALAALRSPSFEPVSIDIATPVLDNDVDAVEAAAVEREDIPALLFTLELRTRVAIATDPSESVVAPIAWRLRRVSELMQRRTDIPSQLALHAQEVVALCAHAAVRLVMPPLPKLTIDEHCARMQVLVEMHGLTGDLPVYRALPPGILLGTDEGDDGADIDDIRVSVHVAPPSPPPLPPLTSVYSSSGPARDPLDAPEPREPRPTSSHRRRMRHARRLAFMAASKKPRPPTAPVPAEAPTRVATRSGEPSGCRTTGR